VCNAISNKKDIYNILNKNNRTGCNDSKHILKNMRSLLLSSKCLFDINVDHVATRDEIINIHEVAVFLNYTKL